MSLDKIIVLDKLDLVLLGGMLLSALTLCRLVVTKKVYMRATTTTTCFGIAFCVSLFLKILYTHL